MRIFKKAIKFSVIFILIFSWIFSGWPQIFNFPPKIQEVQAADSAFLNGTATVVGTTETNIGSLATTLPAGDNLIIIVVSLRNTAATNTDILAGNLKLKKGATVLASNENLIRLGGGTVPGSSVFPQETQFLLYKDAGAAANPTYDVTALASATGISAAVKMTVINGSPPNSTFQDGVNAAIGTAETTILSHAATGLPAGDNVVIAAVQLDNTAGSTVTIGAGNLKLKKGATVLASNQFLIGLTRTGRVNRGTGFLLIARDPGAAAAPAYNITSLASAAGINGEAKIIVLNGLSSAFLDTASVAVGTTETTIGSLATTLGAGENVVISANQFTNPSAAQVDILAGNKRIVANAAAQATSTFDMNLCSVTSGCSDFADGLLWREASAPANQTYDTRALASATGINGEAKILAIQVAAAGGAQTLSFTLSQSSVGFGTLSTTASTYANAGGTGSTTEVEAHTITASTNAAGGYIITVQGATLTSGANTIAAIGGTSAAPNPGAQQFGLRINITSGTGTVTSPYGTAGQFAYAATSGTTSQVASGAGDGTTTTFSMRYLANISAVTAAGTYSTALTYVATGTF